jgi:hypothetical protein
VLKSSPKTKTKTRKLSAKGSQVPNPNSKNIAPKRNTGAQSSNPKSSDKKWGYGAKSLVMGGSPSNTKHYGGKKGYGYAGQDSFSKYLTKDKYRPFSAQHIKCPQDSVEIDSQTHPESKLNLPYRHNDIKSPGCPAEFLTSGKKTGEVCLEKVELEFDGNSQLVESKVLPLGLPIVEDFRKDGELLIGDIHRMGEAKTSGFQNLMHFFGDSPKDPNQANMQDLDRFIYTKQLSSTNEKQIFEDYPHQSKFATFGLGPHDLRDVNEDTATKGIDIRSLASPIKDFQMESRDFMPEKLRNSEEIFAQIPTVQTSKEDLEYPDGFQFSNLIPIPDRCQQGLEFYNPDGQQMMNSSEYTPSSLQDSKPPGFGFSNNLNL